MVSDLACDIWITLIRSVLTSTEVLELAILMTEPKNSMIIYVTYKDQLNSLS